jgi:DNA-binding MarR family transcriptional regulator
MKGMNNSVTQDSQVLNRELQKILRVLEFEKRMSSKKLTISVSQMRILSFFNEKEVIHISEVSRALGLTIQNTNNIVRRLEETGYVQRSPNPENKRFSDITLTAKGKRRFAVFKDMQLVKISTLLGGLEPPEIDELIRSVTRAAELLEKASRETGTSA